MSKLEQLKALRERGQGGVRKKSANCRLIKKLRSAMLDPQKPSKNPKRRK